MPTKQCTKLGCENINLVSHNHSICKSISSSRKSGAVKLGEGVDLQYRCDNNRDVKVMLVSNRSYRNMLYFG